MLVWSFGQAFSFHPKNEQLQSLTSWHFDSYAECLKLFHIFTLWKLPFLWAVFHSDKGFD
jgi:hypothetical protein